MKMDYTQFNATSHSKNQVQSGKRTGGEANPHAVELEQIQSNPTEAELRAQQIHTVANDGILSPDDDFKNALQLINSDDPCESMKSDLMALVEKLPTVDHQIGGQTLLQYAIFRKRDAIAIALIEKGARPGVKNGNERATPLMHAASNGMVNVITTFYRENESEFKVALIEKDENDWSALKYGFALSSKELLKSTMVLTLLELGSDDIDPNEEDLNHDTLLMWAACKTDNNAVNELKAQILSKLIENQNIDITLQHRSNRRNALMLLAANGHFDKITDLMKKQDNRFMQAAKQTDENGWNSLMYATLKAPYVNPQDRKKCVELLIDKLSKSDVNQGDNNGTTAAMHAIEFQDQAVIDAFIEHMNWADPKVEIEKTNNRSENILHYISSFGGVENLSGLTCKLNALNLPNSNGQTPTDIANSKHDYEFVRTVKNSK